MTTITVEWRPSSEFLLAIAELTRALGDLAVVSASTASRPVPTSFTPADEKVDRAREPVTGGGKRRGWGGPPSPWSAERRAIAKRDWEAGRARKDVLDDLNALPGPFVSWWALKAHLAAEKVHRPQGMVGVRKPGEVAPLEQERPQPAELPPEPPAPTPAQDAMAAVQACTPSAPVAVVQSGDDVRLLKQGLKLGPTEYVKRYIPPAPPPRIPVRVDSAAQNTGLSARSDPEHLSRAEVMARVANAAASRSLGPVDADFTAVERWAAQCGIIFQTWDDLPPVNRKREYLGLAPFRRHFPQKGRVA